MNTSPTVSVIVLAWNGEQFLSQCLAALLAQDYESFDVIVVDNASTDGSVALAQKFSPRVRLIRNDYNLGFAGGNNVGLKATNADIRVLLNQDTVVQPGWLSAIVETFADPSIGIVGCKSLYPDGRGLQHAGGVVRADNAFTRHIGWGEADTGQYDSQNEPEYVSGVAFAIHRRVLDKLGELDDKYYPAFYEEVDYCYRARRAGFRIVYQPRAVLYHHETTSLTANNFQRGLAYHRNRVRLVLRHWNAEALKSFVAAERHAVQVSVSPDDMMARERSYWQNLRSLPVIARQRRDDRTLGGALSPGEVHWMLEMLHTLRQQTYQRIAELLTETSQVIQSTRKQSILKEPDMDSKIPVVGHLIDRFRAFWISLVIRHYVFPVWQQQSVFNSETLRALATLQQQTQLLFDLQKMQSDDETEVPEALRIFLDYSEQQ